MNYFCSSGHERRFSIFLECNSKDAVAGKLCKRMSPLVWTSVSRVGAVGCTAGAKLTIAVSPSLPSFVFYFFFLPSLCAFPPPSVLLPSFSLPPGVLLPSTPPSFPLLNAPSGGFGYTGMQSSSQSHFSYSLSQGSRARNQSSDVNEALYSLDRVLHGKCSIQAWKHWKGLLGVMHKAPLCSLRCFFKQRCDSVSKLSDLIASLWDPMF